MRHSTSFALITLVSAPLALPDAAAASQQVAYRLPSPDTATYTMVDTTTASMSTPGGPMEVSGNSSFTYTLSFESADDGLGVSAHLKAFEAHRRQGMPAPRSVSQNEAGVGDLVLVLEGEGLVEVVSGLRRSYSGLPLLIEPHEAMFPRLPPGEVQPGDSWVDTVTTSVAGELERVVAYTYTLVSDAGADGRGQLRIDVSGDTRMTVTENGNSTMLTGSETGFFLWDVERGLVASSEVSRSYGGTVELPEGSMELAFNATTRVRLEN